VCGALVLLAAVASPPSCRSGATKGEIDFADGLERLALGDSSGALRLLERAAYDLGDDPRVLFHIGRLRAAEGTIEGRVRARGLLEDAVRRDPDLGLYRAALGDILRRQRFMRASTDMLAHAVRLDSTLDNAWLLLGRNLQEEFFIEMVEPALLDSSISCYARALALQESNEEARYRLGFLLLHRNRLEEARQVVVPWVYGRPCPVRFGLLLVAIEFHAGRLEKAQELLDDVLPCMTWLEREAWTGLKPLLHPDSVSAYRILADSKRDSMCVAYWWEADPTPTTLANERLLEHMTRAVEADLYFEVPLLGLSGRATDRGEVYMRYGPPERMARVLRSPVPAWEWRYPWFHRREWRKRIRFFDYFYNGNYQRQRRKAGSDFMEPIPLEWQPTRTNITFKLPEGKWDYVLRRFRAASGRTAIDIAFEFEIPRRFAGLDLEAAVWRGPGELVGKQKSGVLDEKLYRLPTSAVGRMRIEVPAERLELGIQAVAVRPRESEASKARADSGRVLFVAFGRDTVDVERFDPEMLTMSDLVLAHELRDGSGGLFDMGGVIAVPHVASLVTRTRLELYFEIYPSRRMLRERTAVAVRYEVRPLPPRNWTFWDQFRPGFRRRLDSTGQPVVQATFTFLPTSDLERQKLTIDVGALQSGPYALVVELVDAASGETAVRTAEFEFVSTADVGS
jgi:GWxTD domain-containing protein